MSETVATIAGTTATRNSLPRRHRRDTVPFPLVFSGFVMPKFLIWMVPMTKDFHPAILSLIEPPPVARSFPPCPLSGGVICLVCGLP
jgi:hypothetical protein